MGGDPQAEPDLYEDLLERARELAAAKRAAGDVPPNTPEALDRLFLEVAPPGAGAEGDGLDALVEMMARYTFDPVVPVESTRPGLASVMRLVKRALRPVTVWQLRYLTDQLNAYAAAQAEVLRAVLRYAERAETDASRGERHAERAEPGLPALEGHDRGGKKGSASQGRHDGGREPGAPSR